MTAAASATGREAVTQRLGGRQRQAPTRAAFLVGLPLGVALVLWIHLGPLRQTEVCRYVRHPAEMVEVVLFCCAVAALATKMLLSRWEWAAFRRPLLPPWDGKSVPVDEAAQLAAELRQQERHRRLSLLGRRLAAALDFVCQRGSAEELDDHLRDLADQDALALESSYALTRFITWAIPILGFLGTVLGITKAIAGVTPEVLEHSLSQVTDGLAEAFDTTALGLALTMITMFVSFLAERLEEGVLTAVDAAAAEQLAHRFQRLRSLEGAPWREELRQSQAAFVTAGAELVQRQVQLWSQALKEVRQEARSTAQQQQDLLTAALRQALEQTQVGWARQLAAWEEQATRHWQPLLEQMATLTAQWQHRAEEQLAALTELARALTAQTEALARLDAGASQLLRLQETLTQNLHVLASSSAFDEAVNSLTAAIHLLTARLNSSAAGPLRVAGATAA